MVLAIQKKPEISRYLHPGNMLFNMAGFFLNQIIRDSQLTVLCPASGLHMTVGEEGREKFAISIDSPDVIWEIVTNPDPGAGDLYVDGKWEMEEGDLGAFLVMMARNLQNLLGSTAGFALSAILTKKLKNRTWDIDDSRDNAQYHYDLGDDLYKSFLDSGMNYSCAFFENQDMSLREAQLNKLRTTIRRLDVQPGMKVLDIGCGWGEACRTVIRETEAASAAGITLAKNQYEYAQKQAKFIYRPLSYFLEDYREHAMRHAGFYDRIFSIGMFEHVGEKNYRTFFAAVKKQLAPNGRALIHSIMNTAPSGKRTLNSPWLERNIFPGGRIPDLSEITEAAEQEGLTLACAPYLQPPSDYAETLRRWRANFVASYPTLNHRKYDERFRRMWMYYFALCEAMFDGCGFRVGQIVFKAA